MTTPILYAMRVSPWSERARWALDHHRIAYRTVEHVPMLGERRLRRVVGRTDGPVTVPVLVAGDRVLTQSWDIAVYADQIGSGTRLIPAERSGGEGPRHDMAAEIRAWAERVDEASGHGRALVTAGMLASPAALDEALPPAIPGWVRPLLRPVTRTSTRWFARKHALRLDAVTEHEGALRAALEALRRGLDGRAYLLGEFTFADIIAAAMLQSISPVDDRYLPLGPATRAVWTHPALAREFDDLIQWRDACYREHRRAAS